MRQNTNISTRYKRWSRSQYGKSKDRNSPGQNASVESRTTDRLWITRERICEVKWRRMPSNSILNALYEFWNHHHNRHHHYHHHIIVIVIIFLVICIVKHKLLMYAQSLYVVLNYTYSVYTVAFVIGHLINRVGKLAFGRTSFTLWNARLIYQIKCSYQAVCVCFHMHLSPNRTEMLQRVNSEVYNHQCRWCTLLGFLNDKENIRLVIFTARYRNPFYISI